MIAHLPRCLALDPTGRHACNCGADAQNDLAAKLDALPPIDPLAGIPDAERVAIQAGAERARRETGMRTTAPWCGQAAYDGFVKLAVDAYHAREAPPPADTPLRAVARMLRRLAARACHHDAARHLLASAGDAVELAAGALSAEEAVRILDGVEPAADGANDTTH